MISRWRSPLLWILLVAAIPRLWGLWDQPVLYFDSGVYLGEGKFLASAAQRAVEGLVSGTGTPLERVARAVEEGTAAHPPDLGKPGHAILVGLSMLALGQTALAGQLVSAIAGIATVGGTYALGAVGWGRRIAIPAALVLAVSGQHIVYSREPLVEADGLAFATFGALVYLRALRQPDGGPIRQLFWAGLLYGLAFTCNNRLSYMPVIFLATEITVGLRTLIPRGLVLALGFATPLALIEGAYLLARGIARVTGTTATWLDYGQQLAAFSRMNPPDRVRFDEWPTYFVNIALMDGLLVLGLFLVGIVAVLRRGRTRADVLLMGSLLVPLLLYSVYSTGEVRMRHFSLALPWVALTTAIGMRAVASFGARWLDPERGMAALTTAVVLLAVPRAFALATPSNGMPAAVRSLAGQAAASTNGPVLGFYLGEEQSNARLREAFVNTPEDLRSLSGTYPTLLVDMQAYLFAGELRDRFERTQPLLSEPHGNAAWYLADLLEHRGIALGGWGPLLAEFEAHKDSASALRVFRLADLQ